MSDVQSRKEVRALRLSAALYVCMFALKLSAYFATGVMALLAEALHSLSDVLVVGFLLFALEWSRAEPDDEHMFGHERGQSVAALVAAVLFVSFTSLKLYEESLPRLFGIRPNHAPPERPELAIGVIVVSILIAAWPLVTLLRGRVTGAAARAQLIELINDELALGAALIGTLFSYAGYPLADPLATAVVATIIAANGIGLFRENFDMVVGRSPGQEFLNEARRAAESINGVIDAHDLRAELYGPEMARIELHITVARGLPIEQAHAISGEVRTKVLEVPGCRQCHIHVDAGPAT